MSCVTLTKSAYGQLVAQGQRSEDGNETGGVLLGSDMGMGLGFVVQVCGDPGPNAVREPTNFTRDLNHSIMLADHAGQMYGSVWIGEWHTHVVDLPMPSPYDISTYRALLSDQSLNFPRLLSLIVIAAENGSWSEPRIFGWSISLSSARQLEIAVESVP
jgi:integrative and conjugative element protein (TIGR02256 family)